MHYGYLRWCLIMVGIVALVLVGQLFQLQVVQGARNQALSDGNRIRQNVIRAPRGAVYDRAGTLLVRNVANFDLIVIPARLPKKLSDRPAIYDLVASLTGTSADEIATKVKAAGNQSPSPILIEGNVTREVALKFEERYSEMPGFSLDTNPVREYVDQTLLSHFLGYTGRISADDVKTHPDYQPTDFIGKVGLEKAFENDLRGQNGAEQNEVDASGKSVKLLASKDPIAGNSVKLSIDFELTKVLSANLVKQVQAAGSTRGAAVALDPRNGQVLAAVNYPSYDNNLFAHGIKQSEYQTLVNNPDKPLFNKVTSGGYPLGSTIKPFIAAAALQEGVINTSTTIEDKGKLEVPNVYDPSVVYTFKGWKPEGLGQVNVFRAIAWSSDIFFYIVGGGFQSFKGLGVNRLLDYYSKFGFGAKTGLDIGDEASGSMPSPEKKKQQTGEAWTTGDTYNISIGQGNVMASPLQLASAVSAVANGGTLYKPQVVQSVVDENGKLVRTIKPEVLRSGFIKSNYLDIVRQGMRQTVVEGTACCSTNREVPVPVSGKTGTAETSSEGFDGKNPRTKPHAWFEAFAPSDSPEIVVVVLVENSGEGAEYALPAVRDTLKWYFTVGKARPANAQ